MRKQILFTGIIVAAAALVFGAGILAQRQYQLARIHAGEEMARDLAGLNDPVPLAPPWREWQYPRARILGTRTGVSVRISEELVRPAGHYAVLVTPDGFEQVARFYAAIAHFENPDEVASSRAAMSSRESLHGESNHWLDDCSAAGDPSQLRPLLAKCLVRRCPSYDLTIFITRADGEPQTHITLLYDPKAETRGGQP